MSRPASEEAVMFDQNLISGIVGAAIPTTLAVIAYLLRSNADARREISIDTAKSRNTQQTNAQEAVVTALSSLILLLKEAIDNLGKANEIASKERAESAKLDREMAGHMTGMMSLLNAGNDKMRAMALSLDDMERGLSEARADIKGVAETTDTLKTDIEGTLAMQFAPVVTAVKGITDQLDKLSTALQNKDAETVKRITDLQAGFGALETTLLKALEPLLIKQFIGDPNGTQPLNT
jgi:chromosome segregation ATPase